MRFFLSFENQIKYQIYETKFKVFFLHLVFNLKIIKTIIYFLIYILNLKSFCKIFFFAIVIVNNFLVSFFT